MLSRLNIRPAFDRAHSGDKKSEGPIQSFLLTRPLRPQLISQFSLDELRRLSKTFFLPSESPDGNVDSLSHAETHASTFFIFSYFFLRQLAADFSGREQFGGHDFKFLINKNLRQNRR